MALRLAGYHVTHVTQWRSLYGLYIFRKNREKPEFRNVPFDSQTEKAGRRAGVDPEVLKGIIEKWMFREPLDLIDKYRFVSVMDLIGKLQKSGRKIIIYSDYDPSQKIERLGIAPDYSFFPDGESISEMKPSLSAMSFILSAVGLLPEELVYVGDRQDKDGASAAMAGIQYIDVNEIK